MATLPMGDAPATVLAMPPPIHPNEQRARDGQVAGLSKATLFSQPIEEQPASTLVDAVSLVARAVTAKIAYHQAQIDALRKALRPFNEMSKHADISPAADGSNDAVDQLLAIARTLDKGGG